MEPHTLAAFAAAALLLALTPGPDMTFVLAQSVARGFAGGLAAMAGIVAGLCVHMTLAAAGITAAVAAQPLLLDALRVAGAAYLIWMAVGLLRAAPPGAVAAETPRPQARAFRQGLVTNLLNPKVGLFFLAFLPQFVSKDAGPVWLQSLTLGALFVAIGVVVLTAVAAGGARLAAALAGSSRAARTLDWLAAGLFGALALRILLDLRKAA